MAADLAHHAVSVLPIKIALIGALGIGAQWLAWRLQRPAIVLMAIAGLIFGPLIGWMLTGQFWPDIIRNFLETIRLNPVEDFGDVYRPMIGLAVAIILFEGGLTLRFKDLGDATRAVNRMVFIAAPIVWVAGAAAAHYIVGLPLDIAIMVGGLFVVTGPTVIMPLLRQAHLKSKPANVLKWEGIVNDPLGALFAVGGFEFIRLTQTGDPLVLVFGKLIFAAVLGTVIGIISGIGLASAFRRGLIPEYLKAPIVLAWVLFIYALANALADETGLLAVTALGMTMANTKFASMVEFRRFKENIAIILVSGVFVILTATLTPEVLRDMFTNWRVGAFVLVMMIFIRPIAVMLSTLWSGLTWREALLIGWIQPRGVVAVAVAGLFAAELQALGRPEGAEFVPLAFALVFASVLAAGFTIGPVAKLLGQSEGGGHGVMIVGANPWTLGLAKALKDMDVRVTMADTNWRRLRGARLEGLSTFYGEVLSENADYTMDHSAFNHIITATPNDAYNALVCVEFAPELGRHRVFQVAGQDKDDADGDGIAFTSRGRTLSSRGRSFDALTRDWWSGWRFRSTKISENYTMDDFYENRGEEVDIILLKKADGSLEFLQPGGQTRITEGTLLSFCAASDTTDQPRGQGAKVSEGLSGPASPLPG
ncbi:cation:proton antiporter [Fretibacter rubidus]|uniref:cation:proton antiporter n=1 Tax=Fretibacter rubidus TaxID=570162 RepID=UPI00352ADF7D